MRIFTASAALAALLLLPGLAVGPSLDAAVFTQVGSDVRHGATLYVTTWDHKPPGVYLLLGAAQMILPVVNAWVLTWLLSVCATAGAATLLAASVRSVGAAGPTVVIVSLLSTAAMAQYFTALGGGLTEPFALFPLSAATYLAVGPVPGRLVWRSLSVGFMLCAAVLLSLQAVPGALVVGTIVILRGPVNRAWLRMLTLAAGALAPLLAVVVWLWSADALPAAIDALVGYAAAYRSINADLDPSLWTPVVAWSLLAFLYLIVPATLGLFEISRAEGVRRVAGVASIAWIVLALVFLVVQGRFIAHYVIPFVIPLGVLASLGLDSAFARLRGASTFTRRLVLMGPLAGSLVVSLAAAAIAGGMEFDAVRADHDRSVAVAAAIRAGTSERDAIWVWGNEPQLYLDAGRAVAGPYSYLYPLVTPGYSTPAMVDATVADLTAGAPAVVVDAGSPAPGMPGFQALLEPRPLASDGRDLDILNPLRDFVREGYERSSVVDGWIVYVKRQP